MTRTDQVIEFIGNTLFFFGATAIFGTMILTFLIPVP